MEGQEFDHRMTFRGKRGTKHLKISVNAQKTRRIKESKRKYSNLIIANDLRCIVV